MVHFNCEGGVLEISNGEFSMDNGWIPIGVEYPEYDKPVLVTDGNFIVIRKLCLDSKIKFWLSDHSEPEFFGIKFWMPLPKLPK